MKKEAKIVGLSYSQTNENSYVVVLAEVDGNRKVPIVIKSNDAQTIAMKMENLQPTRPSTHDLLKNMCDNFSIDIQEVYIYQILEGIFYSKLLSSNGLEDSEMQSNIGDSLIFSLMFDCPLYIDEEVLSICGIATDSDGNPAAEQKKIVKKESMSLGDFKKMMEEAIQNEDYEVAAKLRDKINKIEQEDK